MIKLCMNVPYALSMANKNCGFDWQYIVAAAGILI